MPCARCSSILILRRIRKCCDGEVIRAQVLRNMAIMAMSGWKMKTVNIAELKNRLSTYLRFARNGEEIVIRDRNMPVAKIVPFVPGNASEEELQLVAEGKMRLPERPLSDRDIDEIWKIPAGKLKGREAIEALLADREESL